MCLFSTLDDGTGFTPAEDVLDTWLEEGIENGGEILEVRHSAGEKKICPPFVAAAFIHFNFLSL